MTTTVPETRASAAPRRFSLSRALVYLALVVAALFFLVPIYLLIVTALKTPDAINLDTTWHLPGTWNWGSFTEAWSKVSGGLRNSLLLAVAATALSALLGSLNGYALSKWKFPGADLLFALMLFGMFIPYQAVLIPLFQFIKGIGLYGSLWGLILAHVVYGLPITTLIFRNYYSEVPDALIEASRIDGAGFWGIYSKVIFPLSVPGFVVVVIWQFTQVWNEFLFGVTLANPSSQPITAALAQLSGGQAVSWNLPMAGALLTALPTLLVYILLGRYFVRGLLAGSVKG
ncbi:carbohydrate ABC transporter permease [Deinococcus yavapaiensis]|uniref:Glucose ABC transporter membrane protein /mannose ABC transporter membrane protein n=1 Tax=Deinococcus yavapaiensis KR-236 TaxID=694435 RepID=A0A318SD35_9DEIO|nr:carbohydrate ABC transporter permease [Deinococcus yavapaiensis]PYE54389.1 glucose ABC transporter membrane protein /mannose ABC transporter membrane protein [Deinococcus yavapaiensis KR-236]